MGRSDEYRRYAAECLEMASVIHEPKARATLLHMAQVLASPGRPGGAPRRRGKVRSGRRVRAFPVGLAGEPVPGPSHVLHDLAVPLGLGVSGQAAAFLRKSLVFGCCFHAGITGCSTGAFRMHGGHAGGTVSPATVNRLSVRHPWGQSKKPRRVAGAGFLRPAATPGEETRLRARPSNSLARSKFRPRVTEFH
jgi:hypothetical protein